MVIIASLTIIKNIHTTEEKRGEFEPPMYKPCRFVYECKYSSIKTTTLFATNIINSKISNHSRSFYQMSKTIKSYCKYFLLFEAGKLYFFENKITYRRLHSTESISYIKDTCLNRKKKINLNFSFRIDQNIKETLCGVTVSIKHAFRSKLVSYWLFAAEIPPTS